MIYQSGDVKGDVRACRFHKSGGGRMTDKNKCCICEREAWVKIEAQDYCIPHGQDRINHSLIPEIVRLKSSLDSRTKRDSKRLVEIVKLESQVEQLKKEKGKFSPHEMRILKRVFSEVDNCGWLCSDAKVLYELNEVFKK